jgi:hypothetical protein
VTIGLLAAVPPWSSRRSDRRRLTPAKRANFARAKNAQLDIATLFTNQFVERAIESIK